MPVRGLLDVRTIMAEADAAGQFTGIDGNRIRLDERTSFVPDGEGIKRYMRVPASIQAIKKKAEEVSSLAMQLRTRGHAEYGVIVYNNGDRSRPVAVVRPMNINAIYDDLVFSTLLKAVASVRSDEIPTF